jgi:sec-independent protein translocase protein TatC
MRLLERVRADLADPFAHIRMPFGDHLEALRGHLGRALIGFALGMVVGFFVSEPVLKFIMAPVEQELERFHVRRVERVAERLQNGDPLLVEANQPREVPLTFNREQLAEALGFKGKEAAEEGWVMLSVRVRPIDWSLAFADAERRVNRPPGLSSFTVTEPFMVWVKVSVYCGLVLASPWIFYQLWSFVAAGLYPHEKRHLHVYLPASLALFLGGVALCEFQVLPRAVGYLLGFNDWLGLEPDVRLSDWLSFALLLPLAFGLAFQTPLVMVFLCRVGVVSAETYRAKRRLALFLMTVLAAVFSVAPDVGSMIFLLVPLWGLYELGIVLCGFVPRTVLEETPEEELVEG